MFQVQSFYMLLCFLVQALASFLFSLSLSLFGPFQHHLFSLLRYYIQDEETVTNHSIETRSRKIWKFIIRLIVTCNDIIWIFMTIISYVSNAAKENLFP